MSERLTSNQEHIPTPESHSSLPEKQAPPEQSPAETLPEAKEIRKNVAEAEQASSTEAIQKSLESSHPVADTPQPASRDLKKLMLNRTLNKVQHQLPKGQRVLSKVIHQPVVDRLSEVSSKTIARPSGILSGSLFAFVGSVIYLYITKHDGYQYNYLLFTILFIGGFLLGIIAELLLSLLRIRKHKSQ